MLDTQAPIPIGSHDSWRRVDGYVIVCPTDHERSGGWALASQFLQTTNITLRTLLDFPADLRVSDGMLRALPAQLGIEDRAQLDRLVSLLRQVVGNTAGLGQETIEDAYGVISSIQRHIDVLAISEHTAEVASTDKRKKHAPLFLLNMFCVCKQLKSDSALYKALLFATRAALPPHLVASQLRVLERLSLPGPSLMSRLRLKLDCAYMMHMRQQWADWLHDGCVIYVGSDASPQGGRNYEMVVLRIVLQKFLPDMHCHIVFLNTMR